MILKNHNAAATMLALSTFLVACPGSTPEALPLDGSSPLTSPDARPTIDVGSALSGKPDAYLLDTGTATDRLRPLNADQDALVKPVEDAIGSITQTDPMPADAVGPVATLRDARSQDVPVTSPDTIVSGPIVDSRTTVVPDTGAASTADTSMVITVADSRSMLVPDLGAPIAADTIGPPVLVVDAGVTPDLLPTMDAQMIPDTLVPADTTPPPPADEVSGVVTGLGAGEFATVVLGNDRWLLQQKVAAGGGYRFSQVPVGSYFLKVLAPGYAAGAAHPIVITSATMHAPVTNPGVVDFALQPLDPSVFRYHWEEDLSRAGYTTMAHVVSPPVVTFLDQPVIVPEVAEGATLRGQFNILLSDEEMAWNSEYSYRLLETLRAIPQPARKNEGESSLLPSKWVLTSRHLVGDVEITYGANGNQVAISQDAFVYASPRLAMVEGVRGKFFSKRLHHALVSYVTHQGEDLPAVEKILQERFGCTTVIPNYAVLTASTTAEQSGSFQTFHPLELVELINMFEEMPDGYHAIAGLKYLVRRVDGQRNPRYPNAAAVAWALPALFPNGSYIEFMDNALGSGLADAHRLILHEKAHFLWGYVFSANLKQEWITLGGWYPNGADPDGWSTTKTTEFVTAYAHQKNPDEDMAESLAYFILDPAALQARAMEKYTIIRDRVMQGTRYLSRIQKDLTFEVLNLYPDYEYPGKIQRVDLAVEGAADADKNVTVEIGLHTDNRIFAGASQAYFRLYSPINTYVDVYLFPTDATGATLRGQFPLSKYAKSGFWMTDQIVVTDTVGNQRFEGVNDFGWKLHVRNTLEDLSPPKFVKGSLTVDRVDDVALVGNVSHPIQRVDVKWKVNEDRGMKQVYARLTNPSAANTYPFERYGTFDATTNTATVSFPITEFYASGTYGVPFVSMEDLAGNQVSQAFSTSPQHEPLMTVPITTTDPDTVAPVVSLNDDSGLGLHRIQIAAHPTNPDHPNGETAVTIKYQAKDDKSGVGVVNYRLLDPQGGSHYQYHYHSNFYTPYFVGDPTIFAEYQIDVILPVGSPPGTWGLQMLTVLDKANNTRTYDFVEIVQFQVAP